MERRCNAGLRETSNSTLFNCRTAGTRPIDSLSGNIRPRCGQYGYHPLDENSWAEAELRALPGASIMWGSNSAFRYEKLRGGALETDDILLVWTSGEVVPGMFRHLGKEIMVQDGTTVLMSCEHDAVAENLFPSAMST